MTTGSMFKLLDEEEKNDKSRQDLELIKRFINEQTGFTVVSVTLEQNKRLTIKMRAK